MSSITPTVKPMKESEGKEQYLSEIQKILEAASAPIKPIDHIWTSIFLGNAYVTHVLRVAEEAVNNQVDPAVYTGLHMNYKGFKVLDDPSFDISSFLEPTKVCPLMVEFWFSAQRVSTYLMLYYKMSLKEAVYTVIAHQSINPNVGFLYHLYNQDQQLSQQRAKKNA
ncbi:dual specificity protein phosphatase 13-like [Spea bombifrons]|uniref:dual specificity protein phosphatase 13-like n=1 Tax=Spea bombifrons TaxID=233779 RepID=UPI00234A25B6|nr:dual specificity protein phosphatase 13-like [Spea bombifrons]